MLTGIYIFSVINFIDYSDLFEDFKLNESNLYKSVNQAVADENIPGNNIESSKKKLPDYKIYYYPSPRIVIDNIYVSEHLSLKNTHIILSYMDFLRMKAVVKYIEAEEISVVNNQSIRTNIIEKLLDIFKDDEDNLKPFASSINGKVLKFYSENNNENLHAKPIFNLDNVNIKLAKDKIKAKADLGNLATMLIDYNFSDEKNIKLTFAGKNINGAVSLNYDQNHHIKNGNIDLKTDSFFDIMKMYFNKKLPINNIFDIKDEVTIQSKIIADDNTLSLNELKIFSDLIDISGEVNYFKLNRKLETKMDIAKINYYQLAENYKKVVSDGQIRKFTYLDDDIYKSDNGIVNINMDSMILNDKINLNKFEFKANYNDKSFIIDAMAAKINKHGYVSIKGKSTHNNFRSLFDGQVDLAHDNLNDILGLFFDIDNPDSSKISASHDNSFKFVSKISLTPVNLSLDKATLITNKANVTGNLSTKFIGNTPRVNANIRFSTINFDDENFYYAKKVNDLKDFIANLSSKYISFLDSIGLIRKINSDYNIGIVIDSFKFNDKKYNDLIANLMFSKNEFHIKNFYVTDGKYYIDFAFDAKYNNFKPEIALSLRGGNFKLDYLTPSKLIELSKIINKDSLLKKIDLTLNANIDRIETPFGPLSKVRLKSIAQDNLLDISSLDANLLGGEYKSSGSILLEPLTYNFVYAITSLNLEDITHIIPNGYLSPKGGVSLSGMWSTGGDDINKQFYNLYTKSEMIAKGVQINNFSIDDLVPVLSTTGYKIADFKNDLDAALLKGQTEVKEVKGHIELNKGILNFKNLGFKTKYTAGLMNSVFNLYDNEFSANSLFSFQIAANISPDRFSSNFTQTSLPIKIYGNYFLLKKEADIKEVENILKNRIMK